MVHHMDLATHGRLFSAECLFGAPLRCVEQPWAHANPPYSRTTRQPRMTLRSPLRLLFLHGMDTYAEFQVGSMNHKVWLSSQTVEWTTMSAPNRGADFSSGAGGAFLRERFGYKPRKSRSWRLIAQYSLTSASQAEMFA